MSERPLVSVIIPCYNHARYLPDAISSVCKQDYPNIEIIVVDDGSTEDIRSVVNNYNSIKYIRQSNKGLCAARNTGIIECSGEYLLFLDADDWLLDGAISTQILYLENDQDAAFVSGTFVAYEEAKSLSTHIILKANNPYQDLLQMSYIGVPASVLYRSILFNKYKFNTSNDEAGDYDIYLKISRNHKVIHHHQKIAAYRKHDSNMSNNYLKMLIKCLEALNNQKKNLKTEDEIRSFKSGHINWKMYYGKLIFKNALEQFTHHTSYQLILFTCRYPIISAYYLKKYWKRLLINALPK